MYLIQSILSNISNSYPSFWDTMSTYYLFDSAQSCCLKLYKNDSQYVKDCQIIEACSGQSFTLGALGSHDIGSNSSGTTSSSSVSTTSSTSADPNIDAPCALSIWHPSLDFKRCTNEPNWPNSWNSMQDQYLHDSSSSCCDVFFNSPCYVEDTCSGTISTITAENPTPTKCEELRYHPTTDFTSCTNEWVNNYYMFLEVGPYCFTYWLRLLIWILQPFFPRIVDLV